MVEQSARPKVLVACEESQEVCKAFRKVGCEAYSCDLQEPSGGHPEWHILGDAVAVLEGGNIMTMDGVEHDVGKWDLLIAHPPCTYLSNAGAAFLWKGSELQADRVMLGIQGRDLFRRFWWADIPKICIENPVPSKVFCLPPHSQMVQPYEYGHCYTKKTYLWLRGLPQLFPTCLTIPEKSWVMEGPYKHNRDRAKNRSKTFSGIARAMAEQWGTELMEEITNEIPGVH